MLLQTPPKFLVAVCAEQGIVLPERGRYGVGMVFMPQEADRRAQFQKEFDSIVIAEGQIPLGWRDVPTRNEQLGESARRV
jgi:glutamate synthase domain-containing protein 1